MEKWKEIKGYCGIYEISNYGRLKSYSKDKSGKIRTQCLNNNGYVIYSLWLDNKRKSYNAHVLVWDYFGDDKRDGRRIQVDHIDGDKSNNNINNLQLLTSRDNKNKSIDKTKTSSKYIGVNLRKDNGKWNSSITINGKRKTLGSFETEYEAHLAYKNKLNEIEN